MPGRVASYMHMSATTAAGLTRRIHESSYGVPRKRRGTKSWQEKNRDPKVAAGVAVVAGAVRADRDQAYIRTWRRSKGKETRRCMRDKGVVAG